MTEQPSPPCAWPSPTSASVSVRSASASRRRSRRCDGRSRFIGSSRRSSCSRPATGSRSSTASSAYTRRATLGWNDLVAETSGVGIVDAKVQIAALHGGRGLTEIEEAWLVRSLYREDGLSQPEIARRLSRHKSWVCRRLLLVEALDPTIQADVRLGLLAPRAAVAVSALPRGNQRAAAAVVIRRGLTVRQTELFVAEILERQDDDARADFIARHLEAGPGPALATARPPTRALRNEADWIAADVATLLRIAGRLQARLLATPLGALAAPASVVLDGLVALAPVLAALVRTVAIVTGERAA